MGALRACKFSVLKICHGHISSAGIWPVTAAVIKAARRSIIKEIDSVSLTKSAFD
jgi:hypothetical protein